MNQGTNIIINTLQTFQSNILFRSFSQQLKHTSNHQVCFINSLDDQNYAFNQKANLRIVALFILLIKEMSKITNIQSIGLKGCLKHFCSSN